ncbi:MAG: hypothetical protein IKF72_14410 [Kiritimatiellae bacterium]|nr:hypothetical protein [Kiritimatiellia bacterium]
MAEVRRIECDMCGAIIVNGYEIATSYRRRIEKLFPSRGNCRFDLCDDCFSRIKEACKAKKEGGAK